MVFIRICPERNLPLSSLIFSQLDIQTILPSTYVSLKSISPLRPYCYYHSCRHMYFSHLIYCKASELVSLLPMLFSKNQPGQYFFKRTHMISPSCLKPSKGISHDILNKICLLTYFISLHNLDMLTFHLTFLFAVLFFYSLHD